MQIKTICVVLYTYYAIYVMLPVILYILYITCETEGFKLYTMQVNVMQLSK